MTRDTFDQFQQRERGRFGDGERPCSKGPRVTGASNLVDLDLILHNDNSDKDAIAVSERKNTPFENWKWLPRSQIEYLATGFGVNGSPLVRVTLPEWLARDKGLI
jgi:hypothetical protein